MPPNNLRSVAARCRSYSASRRSIGIVSKGLRFLTRATGLTLGWGTGHLVLGGGVTQCEELRQKDMREYLGKSWKIDDLREQMWPEVKDKMWFQYMNKRWFQNMENMMSDLRKDLKKRMWSFLSGENMPSDRKS